MSEQQERREPPEWFSALAIPIQRLAIRAGAPQEWLSTRPKYQPEWVTRGQEWRSMMFFSPAGLGPSYLYGMYERAARAGWIAAPADSEAWMYSGRISTAEKQYATWAMHPAQLGRTPTAWQQYGGQGALANRAYWQFQQDDWTSIQMGWSGWRAMSAASGQGAMVRALGFPFADSAQRLMGGAAMAQYMRGLPQERAQYTSGWWMGQPETPAEMLFGSIGQWTIAQTAGWTLRDIARGGLGAVGAGLRTSMGIQALQPWLGATMTNLSSLAVRQMWGQPLTRDELQQMNQTNVIGGFAFNVGLAALLDPNISGRDFKGMTVMQRFQSGLPETPQDVLWQSVKDRNWGAWGTAQTVARIGGFFVGQYAAEKAYESMGYPLGKEWTATVGYVGGQTMAAFGQWVVPKIAYEAARGINIPTSVLLARAGFPSDLIGDLMGRFGTPAFATLEAVNVGPFIQTAEYAYGKTLGWQPGETMTWLTRGSVGNKFYTIGYTGSDLAAGIVPKLSPAERAALIASWDKGPLDFYPRIQRVDLPSQEEIRKYAIERYLRQQATETFSGQDMPSISKPLTPSLSSRFVSGLARGLVWGTKNLLIPFVVSETVANLPRMQFNKYGMPTGGLIEPTEQTELWGMVSRPIVYTATQLALNWKYVSGAIAAGVGGITAVTVALQVALSMTVSELYSQMMVNTQLKALYPERYEKANTQSLLQWDVLAAKALYPSDSDIYQGIKPSDAPVGVNQNIIQNVQNEWATRQAQADAVRVRVKGYETRREQFATDVSTLWNLPSFYRMGSWKEAEGAWKDKDTGAYYLPGQYDVYQMLREKELRSRIGEYEFEASLLEPEGLTPEGVATYDTKRRWSLQVYIANIKMQLEYKGYVSSADWETYLEEQQLNKKFKEKYGYEEWHMEPKYYTSDDMLKLRESVSQKIAFEKRFNESISPYSFLEAAPWGGYFGGRGLGRTSYYTANVAAMDLIRGMTEETFGRGLGTKGERLGITNTWEALARAGVPSGVQALMRASGWYGMGERLMQQADVGMGRRESWGGVSGVSDAYAASVWSSTIKEFMAGGTPWGYSAQPESFRGLGMLTAAAGVPFFGGVGRGFVTPTYGPTGTTYQYASGLHMYAHAVWTGLMTAKDAVREFKALAPGVWQITEDDILSLVEYMSKGEKWPGKEIATPGALITPEMWNTGMPIPVKDPKSLPQEGYSFYQGGQAFYTSPITGQAGVTAFSNSMKTYQKMSEALAQTYGGAYGWDTKAKLDKALSEGLFNSNLGLYYSLVSNISYGVRAEPSRQPAGPEYLDPVTGKNVRVGTPGGWGVQGKQGDRGYGLVTIGGQAWLTYGNELRGKASVSQLSTGGADWSATTTFDPRSGVGWTTDVLGRTVFSQGGWVIDRPMAQFPGANVMNMRGAPMGEREKYGYVDPMSYGMYGAPMFDASGNTYNPNVGMSGYQYNSRSGQSQEDWEYWSERDKVTGGGPAMVLQRGLSRLVTKPTRALFAERGAEVVTVRPAGFDSTQTATSMRADTSRPRQTVSMEDVKNEVSRMQAKDLRRARTTRGA